jgi:indolepyruvate ferredoxin oxidoreductase
VDARTVEQRIAPAPRPADPRPLAERRHADLIAYQDRRYADAYLAFVREISAQAPALADTVARYLYKLMAYKDEYEVARLLTAPAFRRQLDEMWERVESVEYNLHPPLLRALGIRRKLPVGGWMHAGLRVLARLKILRGTAFDPFARQACRREERELIGWYRGLVKAVMRQTTEANLEEAKAILSLPDRIRGYEEVKHESVLRVKAEAASRLAALAASVEVVREP